MAKTQTVEKTEDVQAQTDEAIKDVAEADYNPAETAQERLARLEAETAATLKAARLAARREKREAAETEFERLVEPEFAKLADILVEIEKKTGKIFRHFSYLYKMPKGANEPELKIRHSLVSPRGESTAD